MVPDSPEQKIADDVQPVIDAAEGVFPVAEVEKVKVFLGKYAKGWVALVAAVAAFGVQYLPVDSDVTTIASGVVAAAGVVGIVLKANAD